MSIRSGSDVMQACVEPVHPPIRHPETRLENSPRGNEALEELDRNDHPDSFGVGLIDAEVRSLHGDRFDEET